MGLGPWTIWSYHKREEPAAIWSWDDCLREFYINGCSAMPEYMPAQQVFWGDATSKVHLTDHYNHTTFLLYYLPTII